MIKDIIHIYLGIGLLFSCFVSLRWSGQWERRPVTTFIWIFLIRPFFWLPLWLFPFIKRTNYRHSLKDPF